MKQVHIKRGQALTLDVPAPRIGCGEILVRVQASCLSVGTEMSGVRASAVPMWKRALRQPEKIAQVMQMAAKQGAKRTWRLISRKSDSANPTGYSASGTVVEVGAEIDDIVVGDRVACSGGGYAYHAEFVRVPRNLCVLLSDELQYDVASTVALGAIALQGIRRAEPTLGETFVVIGLGILGQLSAQLLRVNGCRVIGVDLNYSRIALAQQLGMDFGIQPGGDTGIEDVARLTDGWGADGVIITAASPSDAVVSTAFNMCRKKGRVVLVGDVGLHLNRADFYAKEIDFLISTSYGPGRYDHNYEESGLDYPAAYVRWTENRNMGEYLRVVAEGKVEVEPLISACYPVTEASAAYASLQQSGSEKPLMVLLTYPMDAAAERTQEIRPTISRADGRIRIAVVGAGSFARSTHLPNLLDLSDRYQLQAIVARTGDRASAVAKDFGAAKASTDYASVLSDPDIDAVIIATRHHLHGEMALAALQAGKHVLVEKPLALTLEELEALDTFIASKSDVPIPVLLTGYNRRFSPYARVMAELVETRRGPFILNYRMNAGYLPPDHWVHGPEGGGRNLGEACHIYDLFGYLGNADFTSVSAHAMISRSRSFKRNDNFIATMSLSDGSVASLMYTAMGDASYPKEMAELYVGGSIAVMTDYRHLETYGQSGGSNLRTSRQEKGHKEELAHFADAIRTGEWPITWPDQLRTARLALVIEHELRSTQNE